MEDTNRVHNRVHIIGTIVKDFTWSCTTCGEGFYSTTIQTRRLSGTCDNIPLTVSERLVDVNANWAGCRVEIDGQFRSYNEHTDSGHTKLRLYIFALEFLALDELDGCEDDNRISLDGYIVKAPKCRETPLGREIADTMLAVNRAYGKSDYIPIIFWGRNAHFVSCLDVDTCISLEGRIQSREYQKRIGKAEPETRTAYEVSVGKMEVLE